MTNKQTKKTAPTQLIDEVQPCRWDDEAKDFFFFDMLTVADVAELYDQTPETVERWHREGMLPGQMLGGKLRFEQKDVHRLRYKLR